MTRCWGLRFVTEAEVARCEPWRAFLATLTEAKRVTRLVAAASGTPESAAAESALWVAAERLPQFAAVFPQARLSPPIAAPTEFADQSWSFEDALVEIVRGRLQGLGPVTRRGARRLDGAAGARHRNGAHQACGGRLRDERIVHARRESSPSGATGRSSRAFIAIP